MRSILSGRASRLEAAGPDRRAFTIVELMVIISVIALLCAILLPSMSRAFEVTYSTLCKRNLYGLGQALHGDSVGNPLAVPDPNAWISVALNNGSRDLLVCKEDDEEHVADISVLEDYYILQNNRAKNPEQNNFTFSNFAGSVGTGDGYMDDRQLFRDHQIPQNPVNHHGNHECWCYVFPREANQKMISITDEATVLVSFEGSKVSIESIIGCGCSHCNSDHWLMKGHMTDDGLRALREDTVVMKLGGHTCREVDPNSPVYIFMETASYGMNGALRPRKFGPQQLMLMDANEVLIDIEEPDWEEHVKERHLGKLNALVVGGSVSTISLVDLQDELDLYKREGPATGSLWGHRAAPGNRK